MKVLIAAPHYWTSPFQVAGHHLARAFATAGWDVAYVSNPISPLHLGRGFTRDLRDRFAIYRRGGIRPGSLIWAYVPGALATPSLGPLLGSRWLHRSWHSLTVPNVVRRVRGAGFGDVDLLYLDTVVQGFWLDTIPHRQSVLRIGDRMSGFRRFGPSMVEAQSELVQRVDVVAVSAATLLGEVERLGPRRMIHLPNGVDVAAFQRSDAQFRPPEFQGIGKPIAIYVGAMDEWFDFDTVNRLTGAMPDVAFVFIGPTELAGRRLKLRPNVHLLGRRPYGSLPPYLRHADVGLIPFDVAGHPAVVNAVHPLKLYEYLASGLPVVATRWDELERLNPPASLCATVSEFEAAIRAAITEPVDAAAMEQFAAHADWSNRLGTLVAALDERRHVD
jgi:glycosyltransferase involved in cell wall biosynthesis